jgi:hypothetical protein
MSHLKNWFIGLVAGLALSVDVGCGAGYEDDQVQEDGEGEFASIEQAMTVAANTGSSNVVFAGGKSTTGGIDRCGSGTSGGGSCTTGANRLVIPISSNVRIGVNPSFGTASERSTLHAIASATCATFQTAGAAPQVITCNMNTLADGCGTSSNPVMLCLRVSGAGAATGTSSARSFSNMSCGTVASVGSATFHGALRDVASCRQYTANIATAKLASEGAAKSMTASQIASATQYVTNYVLASAMVGSSGTLPSSANPSMVFGSGTPSAAPVFSMSTGERCRIVNTNGQTQPGSVSFAQNCTN